MGCATRWIRRARSERIIIWVEQPDWRGLRCRNSRPPAGTRRSHRAFRPPCMVVPRDGVRVGLKRRLAFARRPSGLAARGATHGRRGAASPATADCDTGAHTNPAAPPRNVAPCATQTTPVALNRAANGSQRFDATQTWQRSATAWGREERERAPASRPPSRVVRPSGGRVWPPARCTGYP